MDDELYIVSTIGDQRKLCISPLSKRALDDAEVRNLGGDKGYFVYELDERPFLGGVSILAKAASFDAALRLAELFMQPKAA